MKYIKYCLLAVAYVNHSNADFFTDNFFSHPKQTPVVAPEKPKSLPAPKPSANKDIYYAVLPRTDPAKFDIQFLRSREPESMSLENTFLTMIKSASNINVFIETGTYKGDTTIIASSIFKPKQKKPCVHSIELSDQLFQNAQERFKNDQNIRLYHGDTLKILPEILRNITDRAIIFLDAHYSLGETAQGSFNTPILAELEIIKHSHHHDSLLIVDDIRMFDLPIADVKGTFMEGYPTLNMIVEKILEINPSYQCAIIYDTLIAFTQDDDIVVSPVVKAVTMSRLFDGKNYSIEDLLKAELCIAQAKGSEKETLIDLANKWIEKWSENAGFSRHYALWIGLICLAHEQFKKAHEYLLVSKKRGLNDWRIDWYIALAESECFFGFK